MRKWARNIIVDQLKRCIGSPNKVIFSPDEVEITEISSGKIIAKGVSNHTSKVYMFSHFLPYSNPYSSDSC